jgi:tetratricopeptide (TPR) repeat protein
MSSPDPTYRPVPTPVRIGMSDVRQLEAQIRSLRSVDYRHGGGTCRDAVIVRIYWGRQMLEASAPDRVRARLLSTLGDLHNLAGWTCFDTDQVEAAHHHLDLALALAEQGHNDELTANILYRKGRIHLHHGDPEEALTHFRQGHRAARSVASALSSAILYANEAWAHAKLGNEEPALHLLEQAKETFAGADHGEPPDWARFFTETDLTSLIGTVRTELAQTTNTRHTAIAIPALVSAIESFGDDWARSRALCLIELATAHLLDGNVNEGLTIGTEAVQAATHIESVRTAQRMRPLKHQADRHRTHTDARHLSDLIASFTGSR